MFHSLRLRLHPRPSPLRIIFEINFFRNLASAMLSAVLSLYFKELMGWDGGVGLVFFTGYTAAFFSNLYSARIIERLKKRRSIISVLIAFTIIFALFAIVKHTRIVLFLFALYQFMLALFVLDVGLYVKHYSNYRHIAENAGKLGSLGNIGWVVGPFIGGIVANRYGFEAVFLLSSAVSLLALFIFFFVHLSAEDVQFPHTQSMGTNIKTFFREPNLRRTYLNNAGLGFIYSLWDFLPLLMLNEGATLPIIGMTKTLMGITQALFEFPIGQMADRETGERKIFIVGYALASIFTVLLGFTTNLRVFIVFFFIAATGTAFLEMTRDSYFFRQMPESKVELISVYRTSDTVPFLVGQGLAILSLSFMPLHWWFAIGGIMSSFFVYNAWRLKELPR